MFFITGFHGLHVLAGTLLLVAQYKRMKRGYYSTGNYLGLEVQRLPEGQMAKLWRRWAIEHHSRPFLGGQQGCAGLLTRLRCRLRDG